jgi:hypothetical protein
MPVEPGAMYTDRAETEVKSRGVDGALLRWRVVQVGPVMIDDRRGGCSGSSRGGWRVVGGKVEIDGRRNYFTPMRDPTRVVVVVGAAGSAGSGVGQCLSQTR